MGIAPESKIYALKVFNKNSESSTEWFLKALNYAIEQEVDIINLSLGSSDFEDQPFIDKIWEAINKGIIIVAAIGNDGPEYGTLSNPGDMPEVIGVGSLNEDLNGMASFTSWGMNV